MAQTASKNPLSFESLKEKQRLIRDGFDPNVGLRVHRALSWLQRAEIAGDDPDSAFIFYWIAFNAAYALDSGCQERNGEKDAFSNFLIKMASFDNEQIIYNALWVEFPISIRVLLENKYVYQPFWNHHNQVPGYNDWNEGFTRSKKKAAIALQNHDTKTILMTAFNRLYTLRNQTLHGGSTWNSSINRAQIRDGRDILAFLVPIFVDLMMDHPTAGWGAPYYPVVD